MYVYISYVYIYTSPSCIHVSRIHIYPSHLPRCTPSPYPRHRRRTSHQTKLSRIQPVRIWNTWNKYLKIHNAIYTLYFSHSSLLFVSSASFCISVSRLLLLAVFQTLFFLIWKSRMAGWIGGMPLLSWAFCVSLYLVRVYIHTQTHTHVHIYIYVNT